MKDDRYENLVGGSSYEIRERKDDGAGGSDPSGFDWWGVAALGGFIAAVTLAWKAKRKEAKV